MVGTGVSRITCLSTKSKVGSILSISDPLVTRFKSFLFLVASPVSVSDDTQ